MNTAGLTRAELHKMTIESLLGYVLVRRHLLEPERVSESLKPLLDRGLPRDILAFAMSMSHVAYSVPWPGMTDTSLPVVVHDGGPDGQVVRVNELPMGAQTFARVAQAWRHGDAHGAAHAFRDILDMPDMEESAAALAEFLACALATAAHTADAMIYGGAE